MVAVGLGQRFSSGKFLDDIGHLLYVIATFLNKFKVFLNLLGRLQNTLRKQLLHHRIDIRIGFALRRVSLHLFHFAKGCLGLFIQIVLGTFLLKTEQYEIEELIDFIKTVFRQHSQFLFQKFQGHKLPHSGTILLQIYFFRAADASNGSVQSELRY